MRSNRTQPAYGPLRARGRWIALLAAATLGIVGCGQAGGSVDPAGSPPGESILPSSAGSVEPSPTMPKLLVLGGPAGGPYRLWSCDGQGTWVDLADAGVTTAIGRDASSLFLAGPSGIAVKGLAEYALPARPGEGEWHFTTLAHQILSVSRSQSGRFAVVSSEESSRSYLVEGNSSDLQALSPAPRQPFSPLLAWLDGGRVLALTVDAQLVSRMTVIDTSSQTENVLPGVSGVRLFAVSPDRATIAAATEDGVYVGPTSAWLEGAAVARAVVVPEGQVVWNLALDERGTRLAVLSGNVNADGTVSDVMDSVYEFGSSGWRRTLKVALPFERAAGQVWLD